MAAAGLERLADAQELAVMGFAEVVRLMPLIYRTRKLILREIAERRPDLLILIDYPGFHLSLLRKLRRVRPSHRPRILYYISPQVWAWKAGRAKQLASLADHIAVIFPFEKKIYDEVGLPCTFVGHPLLDEVNEIPPRGHFLNSLGLEADDRVVALLPGSREQEVQRHLPLMLEAADIVKRFVPGVRFVLAQAPSLDSRVYERFIRGGTVAVSNRTHAVLAHANASWVKSGSATVEAAYFGNPFVVVYRTSAVTYRLSKWIIKVPYIAMPNLLAGEKIVQELVQNDATPERLASEIVPFLLDARAIESFRNKLKPVREALGEPGAAQRVADIAARLIAS
jgi:lipid-A-disaccharide synthase